jgi:hypothetical protein
MAARRYRFSSSLLRSRGGETSARSGRGSVGRESHAYGAFDGPHSTLVGLLPRAVAVAQGAWGRCGAWRRAGSAALVTPATGGVVPAGPLSGRCERVLVAVELEQVVGCGDHPPFRPAGGSAAA